MTLDFASEERVGFHVQVNHIIRNRPKQWLLAPRPNPSKLLEDYFLTESLGTQCTRRCGGCRYGYCSLSGELTIKERELKLIGEGLRYKDKWCWISEYGTRILYLKYREQMNDMLARGVAQKLTPQEVKRL